MLSTLAHPHWLAAGILAFAVSTASAAQSSVPDSAPSLADDAVLMIEQIESGYAYAERVPEGWDARYAGFGERAARVETRLDLLGFMEDALHRLCDHHAITGPSSAASPAIIPTFADIWIEESSGGLQVSQVRRDSPAARHDVRPGDRLTAIDGAPLDGLIDAFWDGEAPDHPDCRAYAARVLAAGPRNETRTLTFERGGHLYQAELASLYAEPIARPDEAISVTVVEPGVWHLVFNDRLGDSASIEAIDRLMADAPAGTKFLIDLRNTPSGGNTSVARAVLGYFTDRVRPYQRHALPAEVRETGVARSWIEEVSPRGDSALAPRMAIVLVGRWTGSMGEGMAIGFDALGHEVIGSPMAGLLGAIYDTSLPASGWVFKMPVERLAHINGQAREAFVPVDLAEAGYAGAAQTDPLLEAALARLDRPD